MSRMDFISSAVILYIIFREDIMFTFLNPLFKKIFSNKFRDDHSDKFRNVLNDINSGLFSLTPTIRNRKSRSQSLIDEMDQVMKLDNITKEIRELDYSDEWELVD